VTRADNFGASQIH